VASLEIFRTQTDIRLPYVDEYFLAALLKLPVHLRNSGEIHVALVQRYMPGLVKVPNSNTGAPLDAGKFRLYFQDKMNSAMKRLSVLGFRHYTEFQQWYRRAFRETIHDILFDTKTSQRGIFQPDALKTVVDAHMSGAKNYAHLLGTAVGIELWCREFCD
jgi:asparagine synthase (glutamine-hydrolysing)